MKKISQLLVLNAPLLFVELMTILLLGFIAYGEANRKFEEFHLGKMASQVEIIKNALDPQLQAGIPMSQFGGFNSLADALVQSDPYIDSIVVKDIQQEEVFRRTTTEAPPWSGEELNLDKFAQSSFSFFRSPQRYRVKLGVTGKFGPAGSIELEVQSEAVHEPIRQSFTQIAVINGIVLLIFSSLVLLFGAFSRGNLKLEQIQKKVLNFLYLISFIVISTVIGSSVFSIYEQGASAKTEALSNALAQRIEAILQLGVNLDDVSGINSAFSDYKENNPEINEIVLIKGEEVRFATMDERVGQRYQPMEDSYEYRQQLQQGRGDASGWDLAITIPISIVRDAIMSRLNEFLVLMLACGLISWIFLDAGTGLTQWVTHREQHSEHQGLSGSGFEVGLQLVKPAYFLIVFTSALPVSFLPQLVTTLAAESTTGIASATLPFTIFYFIFAATLIPAGRYAEKVDLKKMMAIGFAAELIGLLFIAASDSYWFLTLGRAFSGFAQGIFLIGLNSYTLSITPREHRTKGAAVKVNGRNAALIAGTSIGALLYAYIDYQTIFFVAVAISMVGILYLWQLVPNVQDLIATSDVSSLRKGKGNNLKEDLVAVVKDGEFLKTLIFVGLVGKMAITGVIMFAIPLILSGRGVASEDIGQSIMLYYVASIVITRFASQQVDASGASRVMLIASAAIGGLGMILIGITGVTAWQYNDLFPGFNLFIEGVLSFNHYILQLGIADVNEYIVLLGIILAGISNGMMAAPIMTHIDKTDVAHKYGNKAVAATYLFLERGGHVVGPMVISFMLLFTYETTLGIALFGMITLLLSLSFLITSKQA
ncbi:MAG: MFS transporter [Gammaproteobacteria bacterium]|nr:MFS transporter [Gammaproteobacteria bacterium]